MLYAVTLYATINNIIDANCLQADLDSIALWSQEWQLPLILGNGNCKLILKNVYSCVSGLPATWTLFTL